MLKKTYLIGRVIYVVTPVRASGRRYLVALEKQLPGMFVSRFEKPHQGMVFLRVMAGKDSAHQHHLDYVDKLDVLIDHTLDTRL